MKIKNVQTSVVFVDDGSTDQSGEICDRIAQEYERVVVIHQENGGVSHARNTGIEYVLSKANEGYIAFLDADDLWASGVKLRPMDQGMDLIAFSSVLSNEEASRFCSFHRFNDESILVEGANVQWMNHGHFGAFLYSIRLIRRYKIRFLAGIKANEDIIFWRQATFCAKSIGFRHKVLYVYRMNHTSVSHTWRADPENALHIPTAWNMAKKWVNELEMFSAEEKLRWLHSCEELIGARLLESARTLSEQGHSVQSIKRTILQSELYDYLKDIQESALSPWQRKDLRIIRRSFEAFVMYHRVRGMILQIAKRLTRVKWIRELREKRRYPMLRIESNEINE